MDSNMSEESRNRRREEALARRLGKALDEQASSRGPEPCPDAELIAAYHEQELGPEEAAACDLHFASCSRCRKILAILAASGEAPLAEKEVARLGELVAAAQVSRAAIAPNAAFIPPKRPDWRLRWLVPAVGVAAVLAVWFAVRPPWRGANQASSGTLVAQAPKNEPILPPEALTGGQTTNAPAANQPLEAAPESALKSNAATPPAAPSKKGPAEQAPAVAELRAPVPSALARERSGEGTIVGGAPAASPPAEILANQQNKEQDKLSAAVRPAPAPAAPPPPPVPTARAAAPMMGSAQAQQEVTVSGEAPVVATSEAKAGNAPAKDGQPVTAQNEVAGRPVSGRAIQSFAALAKTDIGAIQMKAPSGQVLWRVGRADRIERSIDAGKTWTLQTTPANEDWLAGAAASDTLCWIVGRNGAIARTTDGEHWEKIAPPPMPVDAFGKAPDLIGVTTTGAQTATVTSADGRRFTTKDGGKTWQTQ